jgi:hypothetical protein
MAEAIKKSDIIENDILKGVIIEFEQAQIKIKAFNDELKQTARLSKEGLNNVKFNSVNDINQAKIAILEANNAIKQQVLLDKGAIEVATALAQAKVKQSKAENDLTKQKERSEAITQKMTRSEQMLQSAYSRVNGWLGKLRNEYRDLAIKKELNGKLTDDEIRRMTNIEGRMQSYDNALKKVDASMGNHQRNVGNYAMAYNGLGNSVNQLTREMPAFANSVGTGFMAISNNLPIFFDEITKIKNANKELIAQGQPVKSVFSQIAGSVFSLGTLLSVGVTLLTVYGAKIVEWVSNLSGANKELEKQEAIRKRLNKESKEQSESIGKESSEYVGLIYQLKQTNKGSKERSDLITKINEQYGTTLQNLQDENKFQEQLNISVADYIEFKRASYELERNETKRQKVLELQDQNDIAREKKKKEIAKRQEESDKKQFGTESFYAKQRLEKAQQEMELLDLEAKRLEKRQIDLAGADLKAIQIKNRLGFNETPEKEKTPKGTKTPKEEKEEEITDLARLIEDEQIKQLANEYIQAKASLEITAQRNIDDKNLTNATADQKAEYAKEVQETLNKDLIKLFETNQAKLLEIEYQKNLKILEDQNKTFETNLNNSDSNDKEIEKQTKKNLIHLLEEKIKLNKQYNKETIELELELAKLKNEPDEKKVEKEINYVKSINEIVKLSADYFIEQSNKKIAQIEKEQAMHEKAYSLYSDLAKNGNIQAKESLALENQLIAEANKKKQTELKKQAQWKMLEAGVSAYAKNSGDPNVKNPVMKTFSDITLLTQLLKSLPSFEVGTEDTGTNGNGIDGRGGFHAILHPNERVLTKEQNQLIGNVSNEDLALTMNKLNSGELVKLKEGATANFGNWQNMALISEIQDLKNIIKNKPDFKIEAGEIIQGAMSIVETKTTNNSVFTNKYMIK